MASGILTLDLGLTTGWAYGVGEKPPIAGTVAFGHHKGMGARGAAFFEWLEKKIAGLDPAMIVFESPLTFMRGRNARIILPGLAFVTETVCYFNSVPVKEQDPTSVKKHFTGNGASKKAAIMKVCRERGWPFPDNNAADAMALYDYALARLYPEDWRRLQVGRDLLAPLPRTDHAAEALR